MITCNVTNTYSCCPMLAVIHKVKLSWGNLKRNQKNTCITYCSSAVFKRYVTIKDIYHSSFEKQDFFLLGYNFSNK